MISEKISVSAPAYLQKWLDGLNNGDVSFAETAFHNEAIVHINGAPHKNLSLSEFKDMVNGMLHAFPDLHFTIEQELQEGNMSSIHWTATGTHLGPLGDMPPSQKLIHIDGFVIDHLQNGKVIERWELWDQAGMLQQLGVL